MTGRVPREQFRAHQWRRKQRTEWTSADGKARMETAVNEFEGIRS
jgi:hypothetical protein